jgi:hypothetical protein
MKKEWNRVCRESRAAHPQFLAIVRRVQKVIGDRPEARTFWVLKEQAGRLARVIRQEARALEAQNA